MDLEEKVSAIGRLQVGAVRRRTLNGDDRSSHLLT